MDDMTFDEAINLICVYWSHAQGTHTAKERYSVIDFFKSMRDRVADLETECDKYISKIAELEKMVPKSIEAIKRGEMVSLVSTAHYRQLVDDNAAMRALIKKHEWTYDLHHEVNPFCLCCGHLKSQGHAPGCEWAKSAGGEKA